MKYRKRRRTHRCNLLKLINQGPIINIFGRFPGEATRPIFCPLKLILTAEGMQTFVIDIRGLSTIQDSFNDELIYGEQGTWFIMQSECGQ
jgi:hypothetical protein